MTAESKEHPTGKIEAAARAVKAVVEAVAGKAETARTQLESRLRRLAKAQKVEKLEEVHAVSQKPENSKEWTKEIAVQVKNGKLPPELGEPTRSLAESQTIIAKAAASAKSPIGWLVEKGETPQSESVAQVLTDIAHAPTELQNDPDFLLVKGAQLKGAEHGGMTMEERGELARYRKRILYKVRELYGFPEKAADVPEGQRELYNVVTHQLSGLESGMPAAGTPPSDGAEYKWDPTKDTEDAIPDVPAYADLRKKLEAFNVKAAHLKEGPALDRYIRDTFEEIADRHPDQVDKIPNFYKRLGDRLTEIGETQKRESRGWSSFWVSPEIQERYFLNPFLQVRRIQDRLTREGKLLDNRFKQSAEHQFQNHLGFVESEDFRTLGRAFFEDRGNWDRIGQETGVPINDSHPVEDHPIYKQLVNDKAYEQLRAKLVDKLNAGDMIQRNYVSWELGKQEQMDVGLGGFAEPGLQVVINDRGFNDLTLDVLDRLGEHIQYGPGGKEVHVSGPVLQKLKNDAFHELWELHHDEIERAFQVEYGVGAALTELDVRGSVDEMYMWSVITGRRAEWSMRGLAQHQALGQGVNPSQYASELGGDAIIKQASRPFTDLELRWQTASDVGKRTIEEIARLNARRLGSDKKWDEILKGYQEGTPEYNDLVKLAFWITDAEKPDQVETSLGIFQYDLQGKEIHPPKDIPSVKKDYLFRQFILRDGLKAGEPGVMAGYGYFGASWNRKEVITVFDALYGRNLAIGLHERTCDAVNDVFSTDVKDHKDLEKRQEKLIHRDDADPTKEGMLVVMARHSPQHIWEALYEHRNRKAIEFITTNAAGLDIFKYGNEATQPITATRPDLFLRRYEMRHQLINKALADWVDPAYADRPPDDPERMRHTGLSPVDYSRSIHDPRVRRVIEDVCRRTNTDPVVFVRISHKLVNDFALREEVLKEVAHPLNAVFFMSVHKIDPRFKSLEDIPKIYQDEQGHWTDERMELIGPWSQRIANSDGFGAGAGLKRWVGDQVNVWKAIPGHLSPMLDAKSPKELEEHLEPFVETIKLTGGGGPKAITTETLHYAYIAVNRMDFWKDMRGVNDEVSLALNSIAERIGGKGYHAVTMKEAEEMEHHAEAVAGVRFHKLAPHFTHETKKELQQLITIAGKDIPMITVYRLWALGLLGGMLAVVGLADRILKDVKRGFSGKTSEE